MDLKINILKVCSKFYQNDNFEMKKINTNDITVYSYANSDINRKK